MPAAVIQHPAELQDGKLVVFQLEYRGTPGEKKQRPAVVPGDYAFFIDWPGGTRVPRLFVYDRLRRQVDETHSFDTFLRLIDRLPRGVAVGWVDTCCVPSSWGMSKENGRRLRATLARGRRRLRAGGDAGLLICTRESIGRRLPGDAPP